MFDNPVQYYLVNSFNINYYIETHIWKADVLVWGIMMKEEEEYKGRKIRVDEESLEVEIEGETLEAFQDESGNYRLAKYAYEPKESLLEVAEEYVDYREHIENDG